MNSNGLLPHDHGQPPTSHALESAQGGNAPQSNEPQTPTERGKGTLRILVVEDDVPLARLLVAWLKTEQFEADLTHDGEHALSKIEDGDYQMLLLDLNLPKVDGTTLLAKLHSERPQLPVLVLTGRNRTEDMVLALNLGADDYLVKPFSLVELLARIRAVLRRRGQISAEAQRRSQPGLLLHREEYCVERDGRRIDLTPREFALLEYLLERAPKPVSRATLMEEVWRVPFDPSTNIVDVYMKYLRDKIDCTGEQKLIRTVRGVGYALACA